MDDFEFGEDEDRFEISSLPDRQRKNSQNVDKPQKLPEKDLDKSLQAELPDDSPKRFDEHGFYRFTHPS